MASVVILLSLCALLAIGFAYIRRHEDDRAWMLWGLSWLALIASIVLGAIATRASQIILPWTDTTYAALMLGAAYACAERRIPRWVVPAAAAMALGRSTFRATDANVPYLELTAFALGAFYLYGGYVLWVGSSSMRGVHTARMLAGAYAWLAILTAWVQWTLGQGTPPTPAETALTNAVVGGTLFGLALLELLMVTGRAREREQAAARARMSDLEVLAALAELGNTEDDTHSLLRAALARLGSVLELDRGAFYLPNERGDALVLTERLRDVELPESVRRIELSAPVASFLIQQRSTMFVEDVGEEIAPITEGFRQVGIGTGAGVPLVRGDEVLGLLLVGRERKGGFRDAEKGLLTAAGRQIAVALQRVRALEGREAEARALRAERRTLRAVLESAPVGILVEDRAGGIALVNAEMTSQLQVGPHEPWIGRRVAELRGELEGRLDTGTTWSVPDGVPREFGVRDPEQRTLIQRARTIQDEAGEIVGRVWISRDATEEYRLENQLRRAQKMETIGTLAGGVAHDFNNQLTAILGNASLLRGEVGTSGTPAEILDDLVLSAQHCARLTNSLLAFARASPISRSIVEVRALFDEVTAMLRPILPSSIQLDIDVEAGLAPVHGDPTQLQQVLVNLAVNARDAIDGAGRIEMRARRRYVRANDTPAGTAIEPGDHLEISVHDDGVGMDAGQRERMFEPFFTTKEVGRGTGLGLSIVFGVVTSHGGFLDVESEPGRGTTIRAVLPFSESGRIRATAVHESEPHGFDHTATILLAEDEDRVRALAARLLRAEGFEVIEAVDGLDAVEKFAGHAAAIDLAILDLTMPNQDGRSTLAALRRQRPRLPVVVMSGYADAVIAEDVVFLSKPFQRRDLLDALHEALHEAQHEALHDAPHDAREDT